MTSVASTLMPDLSVVHASTDSASGIPALEDNFNQRPFESMEKAFRKAFQADQLSVFHDSEKARSVIRKAAKIPMKPGAHR